MRTVHSVADEPPEVDEQLPAIARVVGAEVGDRRLPVLKPGRQDLQPPGRR